MTATRVAVGFLVVLPIAFNVLFGVLGRRFGYPAILRMSTDHVLREFDAGGASLRLTWSAFALTALAFAPLSVLVGATLGARSTTVMSVASACGVLAGLVQALGLARWPFVVPHLARTYLDPSSSEPARAASVVVFEALHRYLGVGVGEHLGYLLTGTWTVLVGVAALDSSVPGWLGPIGIVVGSALVVGSAEFLGRFEERGWKAAGAIVPVAYVAWSTWLVALGLAIL